MFRLYRRKGWGSAIVEAQLQHYGLPHELIEAGNVFEDEAARAQSLKALVEAGLSLEVALDILGYDLPEGVELREPATATPQLLPFTGQQPPAPVAADEGERIEETRRFLRWAKKRPNADPEQFESVVLGHAEKAALLDGLNGGGAADDAPFRGDTLDWHDYP